MAKMSVFEVIPPLTLKTFAKAFVKGLDVWQTTVGTVESDPMHLIENGTAWVNAHFIPIVPDPNCEYLSHAGNQYDPKYTPWVLNVAGQEISSSQAWEIAIRGLMTMVTVEGESFLQTMDDRNKAYTLGNNQSFSEAGMPNPSESNQWGKNPWYEADDTYSGLMFNGEPVRDVDVNFIVKAGSWHVVRSFIKTESNYPIGKIGNFVTFGTTSGTLNLEGYEGYLAPMRELLILMRIYKYILDNNIDENVYDAIKDQKFDFDLYGIPSVPVPEAVDLGLPSGLKWASFNLGATKPEEYGDYYAWGETEPYYISLDPLTWRDGKESGYATKSYKWCKGDVDNLTKYCNNSYYGYNNYTDSKTVLDKEDDAAHVELRGNWRMPTNEEWTELLNNCSSTWTSENGMNGRRFTSNINGNSIFLPAKGYMEAAIGCTGSGCFYFSSSLYLGEPISAWYYYANADKSYMSCNHRRWNGLLIRPVYEEY